MYKRRDIIYLNWLQNGTVKKTWKYYGPNYGGYITNQLNHIVCIVSVTLNSTIKTIFVIII